MPRCLLERRINLCSAHTSEGYAAHSNPRVHRAGREFLCLPSALDAPRSGQLTGLLARLACVKPT
jgi:hypothetical protein